VSASLVGEDGHEYPIPVGSTVYGRGDQADVRLPDIAINRRHVRIDYDGVRVVITDLVSAGGTYVNHRHVTTAELHAGDVVRLGRSTFTVHLGRPRRSPGGH
jgi:pSer/pThr/pTyr-binding forkhead associated (FHA) protein